MIDLLVYRCRIGSYNGIPKCSILSSNKNFNKSAHTGNVSFHSDRHSVCLLLLFAIYFIVILYSILVMMQGSAHEMDNCISYILLCICIVFYSLSHPLHHYLHRFHGSLMHRNHPSPAPHSHLSTVISSLLILISVIYVALDLVIQSGTTLDLHRLFGGSGIRVDTINIPLGMPLIFLISVVLNQIRLTHANKNSDPKQYFSLVNKHFRYKYSSNAIKPYRTFRKYTGIYIYIGDINAFTSVENMSANIRKIFFSIFII